MKKLILVLGFLILFNLPNYSQVVNPTPEPVIDCRVDVTHPRCKVVSTYQGVLDDAAKSFALIVSQRDAIANLLAEKTLRADERKTWEAVKVAYDELLIIRDRIEGSYEKLVAVQQKVIDMYATLVDKLQVQLGKKKGFFDKVLDTIKTIGYILTGAAIGRAL